MPQANEWDWPPPRRTREQEAEQVEARITAERIVLPRQVPRRANRKRPYRIRTRDGFTNGVFGLTRLVMALFLGGILFAAIMLMGAVIRA